MALCMAVTKKGIRCTRCAHYNLLDENNEIKIFCYQHSNKNKSGKELLCVPTDPELEIVDNFDESRKTMIFNILLQLNIYKSLIQIIIDYDYIFQGEILYSLNTNNNHHNHMAYLNDGRLVTTYTNNTLKIWGETYNTYHNTMNCKKRRFETLILKGHINAIKSIHILDNNMILSISYDKTMKIWDSNTGFCENDINLDHTYYVNPKQISDDIICLVSNQPMIIDMLEFWNLKTKEKIDGLHIRFSVHSFISDRRILTVYNNHLYTYDLNNFTVISDINFRDFRTKTLLYIPNNEEFQLISTNINGSRLHFWKLPLDVDNPIPEITIKQDNMINYLSLLKDDLLVMGSSGGIIRIIDIKTINKFIEISKLNKKIKINKIFNDKFEKLKEHACKITDTKILPDGRLVSRSMDGNIRIWDIENKHCDIKLDLKSDNISLFLPDGKIAYIVDNTIKILS